MAASGQGIFASSLAIVQTKSLLRICLRNFIEILQDFFFVTFFEIPPTHVDPLKNMVASEPGIFALYFGYSANFEKLLWIHFRDFNEIL